jgi:SP family sugar porter-like MFS transporter
MEHAGGQTATIPCPADGPAETRINFAFHWAVALVAALGGLLFGYDWVVIGGAEPFYEKFFGLTTPFAIGWAMSCALVGCLLGAVVSGALSDRFGRKRLLLLAALLFTVTSLGTGLAGSFAMFVLSRLLGGVAIGLASNLSPLYIAEIAPARTRGRLVSVNQLTIVIGILLAQGVNLLIAELGPRLAADPGGFTAWNEQVGWRWMFGVTAVPSLLFLVLVSFVPESPRWLARNGRPEQARAVLARLGGASDAADALAQIQGPAADKSERVDFRQLLRPGTAAVLLVGIVLAVFQQLCGINVLFNYPRVIFAAAGFSVSGTLFNVIITGAVNLLFTFVAMAAVDRLGRRFLMLAGALGLAGAYLALGASAFWGLQGYHVLALVVAAIACYACTLAPVTWVVLSEIFPARVRGSALAVCVFALWAASSVLVWTFPFLVAGVGLAGTFWTYAAVCLAGFWFIKARLPETRGKTLEAIEQDILGGQPEAALEKPAE